MAKTVAEINEKIKRGQAVVVTAAEVIDIARSQGVSRAAREIDVVTTGTFGPMCSSGAFLNVGHSQPRIKFGGGRACLNDVPVYTGIAAVDVFLGATAIPDYDPRNRSYPGEFRYGGGHVIEELVAGKDGRLEAVTSGSDCYPRKKLETWINIKDINDATLFNVRNAYQNYNAAANLSGRMLYTYMGVLKPNLGNINYATAGELSPLLNDPYYQTIGIGTRIFLGGGIGYVAWHGTQHCPDVPRGENGVPKRAAGTLSVIGDMKQMKPAWLMGASMLGYGATLVVGIGVPIPILSEEVLRHTMVSNAEIFAPVVDYSGAYPRREEGILAEVSYAELRSGSVEIQGKGIPTSSLSSYSRALEIASILKGWIEKGEFLLTEPVVSLPGVEEGVTFKPLEEKPIIEVE